MPYQRVGAGIWGQCAEHRIICPQEVVLHATLDSSRSTGGFPGPSAAVTGEASHSDDIRFCNEIQTALKISE